MKWYYISLLHRCENCTITFTPLVSLSSFFYFYLPLLQMWEQLLLMIAGHSFLPPKISGGLLFLKFGQRRVIKNCSGIRGLVERGCSLRKGGFPNRFINFPSEKHCFITVGILFFFFV